MLFLLILMASCSHSMWTHCSQYELFNDWLWIKCVSTMHTVSLIKQKLILSKTEKKNCTVLKWYVYCWLVDYVINKWCRFYYRVGGPIHNNTVNNQESIWNRLRGGGWCRISIFFRIQYQMVLLTCQCQLI